MDMFYLYIVPCPFVQVTNRNQIICSDKRFTSLKPINKIPSLRKFNERKL